MYRTDLAIESGDFYKSNIKSGVKIENYEKDNLLFFKIEILNDKASKILKKPIGLYLTIEIPPLQKQSKTNLNQVTTIVNEFKPFINDEKSILVVGLGNKNITPDALGPETTDKILVTRHLIHSHTEKFKKFSNVCSISPGVLGQTGIETYEFIESVVNKTSPSTVIVVDALAAKDFKRLGCTIQISNTGICPGSGVANKRKELNKKTLGINVIAIGIPTVVDINALHLSTNVKKGHDEIINNNLNHSKNAMMVTPREIDIIIKKASTLLSLIINQTVHPQLTQKEILYLTNFKD